MTAEAPPKLVLRGNAQPGGLRAPANFQRDPEHAHVIRLALIPRGITGYGGDAIPGYRTRPWRDILSVVCTGQPAQLRYDL